MAARSRTLKKRSAASSTPRPDPVFFIDECLGTHDVPDALTLANAQVVIHQRHFANRQGLQDRDWLLEIAAQAGSVARRKWLQLSAG